MNWVKIFSTKEEALARLTSKRIFNVSINGLLVGIWRNEDEISAFKSVCPHAGASLADGFINDSKEIVCPMHGYRFSLIDGKEKSGHSCEMLVYATRLSEDGFYVGLK